jgi:hypothetical protein
MSITATFIKDLNGFSGHASLYKLSEPVGYGWDGEKGKTEFVVVSAANVMFSGNETYIFPADEKGEVTDWGEMPGSYRGGLSHEEAISNAGWTLQFSNESAA